MIRGFYSARSGLVAHQEHMNTIANNLANVNTVGFKPMRTAFKDLLNQNLNRAGVESSAMIGNGVKINKNDILMAQGALDNTEYPLDFALLDDSGFFAVQNAAGEVRYTRAGNFQMSDDDGTFYLVNSSGDRVLDMDGSEIELAFDNAGELDFDPAEIGVYRFLNPFGLEAGGDNVYYATDVSGEPEVIDEPNLMRGYLERSGVEVSKEMASVIESQKAFSFSAKMIQVADEVEQVVNSLR